MAVMRIDHPDILDFIAAKRDTGRFENFNFPVSLTDDFMRTAVERDPGPWLCEWDGQRIKRRQIVRDARGLIESISEVTITASDLLDVLVNHAWNTGEPGCIFIDTVNRHNPLPGCGPIECCNPCGEQYLHSGDACNLGAINLEKFVRDGAVDFARLVEVTRIAVRLLDNVVEMTRFPIDRVTTVFRSNRRIGIGIMGLADMLILLKKPYNSDDGRAAAVEAMRTIQETAIDESVKIGAEKGSFPNFEKSVWAERYPTMRNACVTNVAPCGSTSMILDVASGLEPYFALAWKRQFGSFEPFVNKHLRHALEEAGCYSDAVMAQIIEHRSAQNIPGIPEEIKRVFVTALEIVPEDHVRMQSAIQRHCCNTISKTVNFGADATREDIRMCFIQGWQAAARGSRSSATDL
jgi:ribonucleoside-diphosphate reductase alpha chain